MTLKSMWQAVYRYDDSVKWILTFLSALLLLLFGTSTFSQPSAYWVEAKWSDLPGWHQDTLADVGEALRFSCQSLSQQKKWKPFCSEAVKVRHQPDKLRSLIRKHLKPYLVVNDNKNSDALITGYYEPLLQGSRIPSEQYRYPLYSRPHDLLEADPPFWVPEFEQPISRMKQDGSVILPYDTRADLMQPERLKGYELLWVSDPIELFFLQIQGSGRIMLEEGQIIRVGYSDHNGYPYRSIGKVLIERGELTPHQATMEDIQRWARNHPEAVDELLAQNPRFIFFQEQPSPQNPAHGPFGSLGVPLTTERSIAVDPNYIPLGAPVFISTTRPNAKDRMNRLVFAQDTGNAIQGPTRADFFWGYGPNAEYLAGRMKEKGKLWVLLPK